MTGSKKLFLVVLALLIPLLNIGLYSWNQSLKSSEVPYLHNTTADRVAFDKNERVWVAGGGKLSVYQDDMPVKVFVQNDSSVLGYPIWLLKTDNKGRAWVASWNSDSNKSELAVFDETKLMAPTPVPEPVLTSVLGARITAIDFDAQGRIWIATEDQGLFIIDGNTWENYTTYNSGLLGDSIDCLVFDPHGRAWLGTWSESAGVGINIFDGEVWQSVTTKDSPKFNIRIGSIVFDLQGKAWIDNNNGLSVFDGTKWTNYPNLSHWGFLSIAVDGQGRIWAQRAREDGIVILDGRLQKYYFDSTRYAQYAEFINNTDVLFRPNYFGKITADRDGNIWIPTQKGVFLNSPSSSQPITYVAGIVSIVVASNGLIFITALLLLFWFCVALNAWRSIGYGLLGFPLYILWIILWNQELGYFSVDQYNTFFFLNPGIVGTAAGIIGGCLDIFFSKTGSVKKPKWGLVGLIVGSGISFCFMIVANMAQ